MNTLLRSAWARLCLCALLLSLCLPDTAEGKRKKRKPKPPAASKEPMPPPDLSKMGENISLLALETAAKDPKTLEELLLKSIKSSFILPVVTQKSLKDLSGDLKCPQIDELCLSHVGAKVGARYLVYGSAQERRGKVSLTLRLFDAKESKEISAATGSASDLFAPKALAPTLDTLLREAPQLRRLPLPTLVFKPPPPEESSKAMPSIPLYEGKAAPPPSDPSASPLKNRRLWLWGLIVAGSLGGGIGGGLFLATRPPAPVDSDLGRFPVR